MGLSKNGSGHKRADNQRAEILTPAQEIFCQEYAKTRNARRSYLVAYPHVSGSTPDVESSRLLDKPKIALRVKQLIDESVKDAAIGPREVLKRWIDIATADPRELIGLRIGCCRYCHGEGHQYQWREREYVAALEDAERAGAALPDVAGGFGYKPFLSPDPDCPECGGEGVERVVPRDTNTLSDQALLLFGGVKNTRNGVEILIADKHKALENVTRILGLFKDDVNVKLSGDLETMSKVVSIATDDPEKAAELYQKMCAGIAINKR